MRTVVERRGRSSLPAHRSIVVPGRACSPGSIAARTLLSADRWPGLHSDAPRRNTLLALAYFALTLFSMALFAFLFRFVLA